MSEVLADSGKFKVWVMEDPTPNRVRDLKLRIGINFDVLVVVDPQLAPEEMVKPQDEDTSVVRVWLWGEYPELINEFIRLDVFRLVKLERGNRRFIDLSLKRVYPDRILAEFVSLLPLEATIKTLKAVTKDMDSRCGNPLDDPMPICAK